MPDSNESLINSFKALGLHESKAKEAAKNPKNAAELAHLIQLCQLSLLDEKRAVLITALSGQIVKSDGINDEGKAFIVQKILSGQLGSVDHVTAASKYMSMHVDAINEKEFDEECGVGYSIKPEDLNQMVMNHIDASEKASWSTFGAIISDLKGIPELRWANPLDIKNAVESVMTAKFGPKISSKQKIKEPKRTPTETRAIASTSTSKRSVFEEGFLGSLHKPGDNPQIEPRLKARHLEATGGAVWTRFPPEPNGFLHIGHSKAIFVNFGYAAHHGGKCYLRYDDTNPEAEEEKYFTSILQSIRWLGYEPWKITYSSDYFDQLYDLAVELIKRDKAYVCHCTQQEIKINRGEKVAPPKPCKHRNRPTPESLIEFEKMKNGFYKPKEANLRMKQDLTDGNPQMWDLTAYRVLEASHHRTHDKWKIYPTYDFTHCLVDSIENISHSLCTTEFILSRQSYDWLCDALSVYKPKQSEYGRLAIQGTIMSKRKILALVNHGHVTGWDDPRLYTLMALRRRGIPPGAIKAFVSTLGVSTAASNIPVHRFESSVRQYLESTAPRLLMVMHPIKVVIENLPEDYVLMVEKLLHPKVPGLGSSHIPFTRVIFIDATDFRQEDTEDYFRLAPGKSVGLFGAPHPIVCTSFDVDSATGEVVSVRCRLDESVPAKKPKAYIQWVADHPASGSPVRIDETRIFGQLFKSDNPLASQPDFLADLNPSSLEVVRGAMVEVGIWPLIRRCLINPQPVESNVEKTSTTDSSTAGSVLKDSESLTGKESVRFQGLRVGYFALDADSVISSVSNVADSTTRSTTSDVLILNQIVSLKEDSGKTAFT